MKEAQLNSCHPKSFSLSDLLRKVATINYFINLHNLCNIYMAKQHLTYKAREKEILEEDEAEGYIA
jgi:hypothetical protein